MNFFEATVRVAGESIQLDLGGGALIAVPSDRAGALVEYHERRVVMGIRPEHIHERDDVSEGAVPALIEAQVDVVERMGSETFLHLVRDGTQFLARVGPRTKAQPGERTQLAFDTAQLHVFDAETGEAIRAGNRAAESRAASAASG
jgi:multiple sugar transport system ATP-binding protein